MISYEPLRETMEEQQISAYALINEYGIHPGTIHNLKPNKSITLCTPDKLCGILNCQAERIVLFLPDQRG